MPTQRTTDPGVTTVAHIYEVIDNNANVLDTAVSGIAVVGNGTAAITRINGDVENIDIPLSPDGAFSGIVASLEGLAVTITAGTVQRDGVHYDVPDTVLEVPGNLEGPDRLDLVWWDAVSETPSLRYTEGIPGLTPEVLAGKLPLFLVSVPEGEDGTMGTATLLPLNRFAPDVQQLPASMEPNEILSAQPLPEGGTVWGVAGKSETVEADEFATQWVHHKGKIYVRSGDYYSGMVVCTLPEDPGKGWHTTLVDVATLTGADDGPALLLEARGESAPLVNGMGSWELEPGWIGAEVHFDGEQYLVIPSSISL